VPDAHQTLLLDVPKDDQTLFVHADEVEKSWRVDHPIIDDPPEPLDYESGTWGPGAADSFAIPGPTFGSASSPLTRRPRTTG